MKLLGCCQESGGGGELNRLELSEQTVQQQSTDRWTGVPEASRGEQLRGEAATFGARDAFGPGTDDGI